MELWESILISLLIAIILPVVFSVFGLFKVLEEKKLPTADTIRTRPPKILSGFFLGFALLVLCGGIAGIIYCSITDSENTTALGVIVISLCVGIFSGLGFFGYAWVRFNYVVADKEGVLAYRLFRKKKYYRYEEIGWFQDTTSLGMMGSLVGYDKNNNKIFAIEALHIGATAVANRLRDHFVKEKSNSIHY
ncbi:MAG: hypothetical protein K2N22_02425 [Clostridia bacterium]|nr:hypothetical protein [Clostridia bacterium]